MELSTGSAHGSTLEIAAKYTGRTGIWVQNDDFQSIVENGSSLILNQLGSTLELQLESEFRPRVEPHSSI